MRKLHFLSALILVIAGLLPDGAPSWVLFLLGFLAAALSISLELMANSLPDPDPDEACPPSYHSWVLMSADKDWEYWQCDSCSGTCKTARVCR